MPELPEVATMVKAFKPHVMGRHVRHVVADPDLAVGFTIEDLRRTLEHTVVCGVKRHGKYVRIDFEPPESWTRDRAFARPPAPASSVVASRPDTLEELLAAGRADKGGRSGPTTGRPARDLFESTRVRPKRRSAARASLIIHLRMTGRFFVMNDNGHPVPPRSRLILALEDHEDDMLFGIKDTRRLATMSLLSQEDAHEWPEWLELGPDAATARLTDRKLAEALTGDLPIKLALVDQSRLAGLGNIYACEVLHRTRIHPARPAAELSRQEWAALAREIPRLLKKSMQEWCELSRWVGPAVEGYGDFNGSLMVYDREGERCRRCGGRIETLRQAGRTTYFCGSCQE